MHNVFYPPRPARSGAKWLPEPAMSRACALLASASTLLFVAQSAHAQETQAQGMRAQGMQGGDASSARPAAASPAVARHARAKARKASPAIAAQGGSESVTVRARSLASRVQDTPASVVEVSGRNIQARGITSFASLAQATPGVSLKSEGPSQTEIEMRGMTASGGHTPTVGFYLDNTALTGPAGAQNGHVVIDPSLYDLNHIEILHGPQGTTGGEASMGGTVKLVTAQPDPSGYHASFESILSGTDGGGLNHDNNVMVNVPLIADQLTLRATGTENYTSGWINRIVANPFPTPTQNGAVRGDVAAAPVQADYPGSNAYQLYATRVSLLWRPTENLEITPSFFYESSLQNGISAYDSDPGTQAHYQPFDIAEPLKDHIATYSLNVRYHFPHFDLTSDTSQWYRESSQTEDASEQLNNPQTGDTYNSNNGLPNPGFYGPLGSGEAFGHEIDTSRQFSEELKATSHDTGRLNWVFGGFFSHFYSLENFQGTTLNPAAYLDLGTFERATTTNWFSPVAPTSEDQLAAFGDATYKVTRRLKIDVGVRYTNYEYRFSSVLSGWGSGLGAATPTVTAPFHQNYGAATPRFNVSYDFTPDLMVYATVARGYRPGGGNFAYPTTGPYWSAVFAPYHFTNGQWPLTYNSDSVWSYEIGEKAALFDHRLFINVSGYYEDWSNIQLEAYPGDFALNINGNNAKIYGAETEAIAKLGSGFDLNGTVGYTTYYVNSGPHWLITPTDVLPEVPRLVTDVVLRYTRSLGGPYRFTALVENSYTDSRYSLAFPYGFSTNGSYVRVNGYDLTNVRFGIGSDHGWDATLFVDNLFNRRAQLESLYQETLPDAAFNRIVTNQPLTGGVDLTYRF